VNIAALLQLMTWNCSGNWSSAGAESSLAPCEMFRAKLG
jgi:hypothetical protein